MELIDKAKLYEEAKRREELARSRVADTQGNSPAYARYVTQLNERTAMKQMIEETAPVEVETAKHGEWLDLCCGMICSVCRKPAVKSEHYEYVETKHCPNCGAKMDGG